MSAPPPPPTPPINPIPPLQTDTSTWGIEQTSGAPYDRASMVSANGLESGNIQVPVAGTAIDGTQPCEVIQVCSPYGVRVIQWKFRRDGNYPDVPDPRDLSNLTFIRSSVVTAVPVEIVGGLARSWMISGEYHYAATLPLMPGQPIPTGTLPTSEISPSAGLIGTDAYNPNLIGS